MISALSRLEFIASLLPEKAIALTSGHRQLTYSSLIIEVKKWVEWLLETGAEVVALHADNSIEWILIDLACQEMGVFFIPLPAFFTADQIQRCIALAGIDTLISDQDFLPDKLGCRKLEPASSHPVAASQRPMYVWKVPGQHCREMPDGTRKITFTSGSTGSPKGVCLSDVHQWSVAQSLADTISIKCPRHLCLLPFSTLLENIAGVYTPLLSGGEIVIPSDRDRGLLGSSQLDSKTLLKCITGTQPQTMILVPQILTLLVQACAQGWHPPESLQFVAVGGGKLAPQIIRQATNLGLPVYQGYGLSECGSVVALNTPSSECIESVGKVLPHCEASIENNEIVVSGAVHLGYLGDPDSWYPDKIYTGDIGALDDGFLTVDGRRKNILISSFGRNISPEWVESVLMSEPILNGCVVLGDRRPYLIALVSASPLVSDGAIEHWVNTCNQQLPDYAKVGGWTRISDQQFQGHRTANGRPQREKIKKELFERIDQIYRQQNNLARIG